MNRIKNILIGFQNPSVNKSAGKMRAILLMLFFFIFWTTIAQTQLAITTLPNRLLNPDNQSEGFVQSILREMLLRYFSPATLITAIIPLVIFFFIKNMISKNLTLINPLISSDEYAHFLNECAFSIPGQKIISHEGDIRSNPADIARFIGGLDQIALSPDSILVVQNINNKKFYLSDQNSQRISNEFMLLHGERIVSILKRSDLSFLLGDIQIKNSIEKSFDIKGMEIEIIFQNVQANYSEKKLYKVDKYDALFLSYMENRKKKMVSQFLKDTTLTFFYNNLQSFNDAFFKLSPDLSENKNVSKKSHKRYRPKLKAITYNRQGFSRKHRRTRYSFLSSNTARSPEEIISRNVLQDTFYSALEIVLNTQMHSFFRLSSIIIKIIKRGSIKSNE